MEEGPLSTADITTITTTSITTPPHPLPFTWPVVMTGDDDDDDDVDDAEEDCDPERVASFQQYLYQWCYCARQYLWNDTAEQHDDTHDLEWYQKYHAQQLQDYIRSHQQSSSSSSSSSSNVIPQLLEDIRTLLLQMGQLSLLSSSSSPLSSLSKFFLPPRPPEHLYYAHDLRPKSSSSTRITTERSSSSSRCDDDMEDDDNDDEIPEAVDTSSYQYRRIDLVRRLLRSLAPVAMDLVARLVEQPQSSSSTSCTTMEDREATFVLLGIWLPVAPQILPLVTFFLQSPRTNDHDDENAEMVDAPSRDSPLSTIAEPLWSPTTTTTIPDPSSWSTPVVSSSSSPSTNTRAQMAILVEVTWIICQAYQRQQNSQTLRNLPTWFWEPIFMWLRYDNPEMSVPQRNYYPAPKEHVRDPTQPHDRQPCSSSEDHCEMEVDPPCDGMVLDVTNDDEVSVVEHDTDDDDDDEENCRKFRITRDEWTYEIQIMWYVMRIIAYLRRYTPIYTKELLLRYNVYYHHHYVPWHMHDFDRNDEETWYQHFHVALGQTYLGPYLPHVRLPRIRTVREFLPLHPYLLHLGGGLVFVKYPLPTTLSASTAVVTSIQSHNNDITMGTNTPDTSAEPQQQRLIRTATTKKNIYDIGTIMCIQPPVPILVAGPNGSGKSSLVREIAQEFHSSLGASHHVGNAEYAQVRVATPLLEIHVDDETDTKTLVGSYTVTDIPGEFEWRPGALTSAVMSGQWVLFEDFDTVPMDIQASLEPLFKYRTLPLGNGTTITCHPNFRLFGTVTTVPTTASPEVSSSSDSERANTNRQATRSKMMVGRGRRLFNPHVWTTVYVDPLPINELNMIGTTKYPNIPNKILGATIAVFFALYDDSHSHQSTSNNHSQGNGRHDNNIDAENVYTTGKKKLWLGRCPSVRDLFKVLSRISHGIPFERNASYATESQRVLCLAEMVDVFVAACPNPQIRREFITQTVAPILNITTNLGISYIEHRNPSIVLHDTTTEIGRVQIMVSAEQGEARSHSNRFAQTPYSLRLMESIGVCIRENEPTLLVGETGTGKTTILQHLAKCCGRELLVQNLSLQTDSTDLLGGYRPLEMKHVARNVYQTFVDLFTGTFSRKQNADFLTFASLSLQKEQWAKLSQCFQKAAKLGLAKLKNKSHVSSNLSAWERFDSTAERFEKQRLACASGLAFNFTEGALVDAIRTGKWVLLDEINLASCETLQRLCGLLDNASSSLTLTEKGDATAVDRHPSFRLFAAMNPATDSGKKDLTPSIRARFTELFVDELLDPVQLRVVASQYISGVLPTNERPPEHTDIIITIVDLYLQCRDLADRVLVDGTGQKPRYTLRTLSRALSATNTIVREQKFQLNRALYEGFHLAFQGPLDEKSLKTVDKLLLRTLSIETEKNLFDHPGKRPGGRKDEKSYELIKPFWIPKGPLDSIDWSIKDKETGQSRFVLVPSTMSNLRRIARAIASGPWPLLLEGPTSAGKTTLVEYIGARCGHRVVRINNHEHTDIQEYTGGFAADSTGALKFVDGILVQALRLGYWVILDELNLAPSEVLEALNRLLDDNRELYIPEINETIKPHERFRLFATQNPSGAYGGRKPLSRAFRNRFVEIQINDIPSYEMITILEKRCGCPPSHAKCLVEVMDSLRQLRSKSGVFLGKDGLITPRDLLRWADRAAPSKYELALEGYMLLAERLRSLEEQYCVKDVLEKFMKVKLDIDAFYYGNESEAKSFLNRAHELGSFDENTASFIKSVAPTKNLLRLVTLVHRCVKKNEPVLLVGETGCGKTVSVQLLSILLGVRLHAINCHQTTETSDLIGGLRPVRGRQALLSNMINLSQQIFSLLPNKDCISSEDIPDFTKRGVSVGEFNSFEHDAASRILHFVTHVRGAAPVTLTDRLTKRRKLGDHLNPSYDDDIGVWVDICNMIEEVECMCHRFNSLFEWTDGPLVTAMKNGELVLLDEISLADDAVLERLNSVLEPGRTIVLAEKGAVDDNDSQYVKAQPSFQLFATMNPGGDFGKRELSPALRSRFTEIWVPPVSDFTDIELVLEHALSRCALETSCLASKCRMMEYVEWFNGVVCCESASSYGSLSLSLRDILSWAHFMVDSRKANNKLDLWEAYAHGARLMHLDGLGLGGGLSMNDAYSLRQRAESFMALQLQEGNHQTTLTLPEASVSESHFGIRPFWIRLGNQPIQTHSFNFGAPTTSKNVFRVLRALQVSKPILLEGSPGVGKTTLIGALAESSGHSLVRINLSEQTDMADLIGSDLPVADSSDSSSSLGSSFRWFDGVLLTAIKNGDWVLLDELNLASQSVLEGLNSCLDHRMSVFVPELGQSFNCPPSFRIFAAQNPMGQGGGRKGLPKSFLNRFTKVYVDSLDYDDLQMIVRSSFPNQNRVDEMVTFNTEVSLASTDGGKLGRLGSPWEFNLRDVFRWCELFAFQKTRRNCNPGKSRCHFRFARDLYLNRFRTVGDRDIVKLIYDGVFAMTDNVAEPPTLIVSEKNIKIGDVFLPRKALSNSSLYDLDDFDSSIPVQLFEPMEAVARSVVMGWPCLLVGKALSGKTTIVRSLAKLTNSTITEIFLSSSSDVSELVGCFERDDNSNLVTATMKKLIKCADEFLVGSLSFLERDKIIACSYQLEQQLNFVRSHINEILLSGLTLSEILLSAARRSGKRNIEVERLRIALKSMTGTGNTSSKTHFSWKDGALVKAMRSGHWLHLRNANLCSSSVLDRLNSVLEPSGYLLLAESGTCDVTNASREVRCHPNFRVFLSMNPDHGEVSRAMRNRCVEVSILEQNAVESIDVLNSCRAFSKFGLRMAPLATAVLRPLRTNACDANTSSSFRVIEMKIAVFSSLVSRGMRKISPLLQNRTPVIKLDGNLIEAIPSFDELLNWALFPEFTTIQFWAMAVRSNIGSMRVMSSDGDIAISDVSGLWKHLIERATTATDIFSPFICKTRSKILIRDHLMSLLVSKADPRWISKIAVYFEQVSNPIKFSMKFFADSITACQFYCHWDISIGQSTFEGADETQQQRRLVPSIARIQIRRTPQLFSEQMWLDKVKHAFVSGDLPEMSVLDVSYNSSCGNHKNRVIDCPVTPFLWMFINCLDEVVRSLFKNVPSKFDDCDELAILICNFFCHRDGMWKLLESLKFISNQARRPCFAVDDFIAQWLHLRNAFEKLQACLSHSQKLGDAQGRLDVLIETIERGIFDYAKGEILCGSIVLRKNCSPVVPRQVNAWGLLLKARSISRTCVVDRRSFSTIYEHSMMTLRDCCEHYPVLFVLNDSTKKDVLSMLCTIQMSDLRETTSQTLTALHTAVRQVPNAIENYLTQALDTFRAELSAIQLENAADNCTFTVDGLAAALEQNDFVQDTFSKLSESRLLTFAHIQLAACFELWCESIEADFLRVLACAALGESTDLHESITSHLALLKRFVSVALSRSLWNIADLQPYQTIIWLCEGSSISDTDWRQYIKKLIPTILLNVSKRTWLRSFDLYHSISLSLELPLFNCAVATGLYAPGRIENQPRCRRRSHNQGLTMSLVFSLLHNSFEFDDSSLSRVKFATIENYISREWQICRLVELISASRGISQSKPFDIALLYDEVIMGLGDLIPNELRQGLASFISNPQSLRDKAYEELLEFSASDKDSVLRNCIHNILLPLLRCLENLWSSESATATSDFALSKIYVGLLRFHLLLPISPIDPGRLPLAQISLIDRRLNTLGSEIKSLQLDSVARMGQNFSGNDATARVLAEGNKLLASRRDLERSVIERPQIGPDFSEMYEETLSFSRTHFSFGTVLALQDVISKVGLDSDDDILALQREHNWQSTTEAFCENLMRKYIEYEDVVVPLISSVGIVKHGIQLFLESKENKVDDDIRSAVFLSLSAFPVCDISSSCDKLSCTLQSTTNKSSNCRELRWAVSQSILSQIVLMGKVVAFDGKLMQKWLNVLDDITDQLNERTGSSRPIELSDEEKEIELQDQFPNHRLEFLENHDSNDMMDSNGESVNSGEVGQLDALSVSDSLRDVVCFLHQILFHDNKSTIDDNYRITMFRLCFNAARKANELLGHDCSHRHIYRECASGLVMALALISPSSRHLIKRNGIFESEIDFHKDPNPQESIKAGGPLRRLLAKVTQLLVIFPDNTILSEILTVCERVSKLDLHRSSLGRVLTGLELILKHSQDWEQHATIRVRLGIPLIEIGRLVTTWRKFELQSWAELLKNRESRFARRGREHWTRIHIILRRYVISLTEDQTSTSYVMTPRWAWKGIRQDVQRLTMLFRQGSEELLEIMKVLDTFCLTSPLGEFFTRLQLLRAFARQLKMEASLSPTKHPLQQLSLSLQSLCQYYDQFSVLVNDTLNDQRRPFESRLQQEIKLAKWDEQTYYAMAESTERNHRKLMSILFDYDRVLNLNVMSCIEDELSRGIQSDLSSGVENVAAIPGPMLLFPLESTSDLPLASAALRHPNIGIDANRTWTDASQISSLQGEYFYKVFQLSVRMNSLIEKPIGSLPRQGFCVVRDLCETIFERIELLRSEKTTRPMKERALTDLFKELKRQGYSPNKWSTPSEMQRIFELFQLPSPMDGIRECIFIDPSFAKSSERYYQRCLAEAYRFRAEVSMYGSEHLTARQLDMMLGFSDNGLYLVIQQRCIISCIVSQRHKLARLIDSISHMSGKSILTHQSARKSTYLTLKKEFAYCLEGVRQLVLLIKSSRHLMDTGIKQTWSREASTKIEEFLTSVDIPSLLEEIVYVSTNEVVEVQKMKADLDTALHTIRLCREESVSMECFPQAAFEACESQMGSLVVLMKNFLRDAMLTVKSYDQQHARVELFSSASYVAIEDALLFAQTCLKDVDASHVESEDTSTTSIWDLHAATTKSWKALYSRNMVTSFETVLRELSAVHENEEIDGQTRDLCTGFTCDIGFLYRSALTLYDKILSEYMSFYRGTTKLQYIILRIFRVLRASGFCSSRPNEIDKEGNADGGTSGMTFEDDKEGTGMGEGDGKTDVTDQLENEEQLLGLKDEKGAADSMKSPDPKQLNKDEADQGMEMEGDFDGELYELPERIDVDNDNNSDDENKEEVDREMGEEGSPNEEVIDEKLWDEDDDDGNQDTKEEKFEQNSSVKGDGAADEMITKDENDGSNESNDIDNNKDSANSEKRDDVTNDEEPGKINDDTDDIYEDNRGVNVRDETQMKDEQDEINLDENISINDDADNLENETSNEADESDHEEGKEATNNRNEPVTDDTNAESENENEAEPALEANSEFGQLQSPDGDCADEELPNEEHDLPKANLPRENIAQSGLGVRDEDGGDALQEDALDESEEIQKDSEEQGGDDGSGKMDQDSSGGGQGAGSAAGQNVSDTADGSTPPPDSNEIPNPLKNPGDASKFWHQRLNIMKSIIDADNENEPMIDEVDDKNGEGTFEYTNEKQDNLPQTLGETDESDAIQLDQKDEDQENDSVSKEKSNTNKVIPPTRNEANKRKKQKSSSDNSLDHTPEDGASDTSAKNADHDDGGDFDDTIPEVDTVDGMDEEETNAISENHVVSDLLQLRVDDDALNLSSSRQQIVEVEQTTGHSTAEVSCALTRWSLIQSETHNLSRRLCEKLRLVMEPLVASKLRGDYRTGKRINMKRVIGYIASGYRKDKIWLRRTKPAKRDYRVLVAVDDSESMFKNGAGDMALKAMATLAVGMTQLEVGEVGIASFGNEMNLVHPFEQPFTLESGSKIVQAFQFKQQRTKTALCIESAMLALEGHHGDHGAMQLVFMISDGRIERDSRSTIRKCIREMMDQNILLVLIIVEGSDSRKDSIMNMKEVTFDKGKPQFKHFIDDYPFPYYIVLNDMQSLPEVLGDALKQWFEMLARLQSNT